MSDVEMRTHGYTAGKDALVKRLHRIEGQVRGIEKMVEDDRYCIDILTQTNAIKAALHKVEEAILRDHVSHCVAHAFAVGGRGEQRAKIEELVTVLEKLAR